MRTPVFLGSAGDAYHSTKEHNVHYVLMAKEIMFFQYRCHSTKARQFTFIKNGILMKPYGYAERCQKFFVNITEEVGSLKA